MTDRAEKIGQMFLRKKLVNDEQLNRALQEQAHTGKFLGETLIGHGVLTERDLLETLAEQFHTHFVVLENLNINPLITRIVPKSLVWEHKFMPIEMRRSILLIAVSNPLDVWPISVIQDKLDLAEAQIVLATQADIIKTIKKYYGAELGGGQ